MQNKKTRSPLQGERAVTMRRGRVFLLTFL
jgi:hypothetical protein